MVKIKTGFKNNSKGPYELWFKRPLDMSLALAALIVLSPLLLVLGLLIRTRLGSPIIFKQERAGLNQQTFWIYKFRSMTNERSENRELLPDHLRMTRFGRFLRNSSLDELPELFNILRGEMSLIGPRPLLVEYVSRYNAHQRRRHEVRPGLSGLAQISGRNAISWEERFHLDVEYVDQITFAKDMEIIFKTLIKVFKREGINATKEVTMEIFKGSQSEV